MNGNIIIVFASPTITSKAKKLLTASKIPSKVIKISSKLGCSYALAVPHNSGVAATEVLSRHSLTFRIGAQD